MDVLSLFRRAAFLAIAAAVSVDSSLAQAPGGEPAPAPGGTGSPGGQTGGQPGNQPGSIGRPDPGRQQPGFERDRLPYPEQRRSIFLSGKVTMDDGTAPPTNVVIERVCNGTPRPEGYTDSKGRFSLELGRNQAMMADASTSSGGDGGFGDGPFANSRGGALGSQGARGSLNERDLMGCELRASLPGFRSEVVSLAGRRMLDNPDVGTIVLRRLAKVDGFTFSATSALAPKEAQKAFEKGKKAAAKQKWEAAEQDLQKATELYSRYAAAWYELGTVYHQQKKIEEARRAYGEALKADEKFINPYAQLTRLAASENKWEDVATYSDRLLRLNPFHSPEVYFYSAVANFNLQKLPEAEEHAREAVKMDPQHRNPKAHHLLGLIQAQQRNYTDAAQSMRSYLQFAPAAADADVVKKQLAEVERLGAGGAAQAKTAGQ